MPVQTAEQARRDPRRWHLALLLLLSLAYEARFLNYGHNRVDEGWPLYAAMRLHDGGVLYRDAFFVFPPGHLLAAWIGYGVDPPGIVVARAIYGAFNVALCLVMYLFGRRIMPPWAAFLGAAFLALAAPRTHQAQHHFGYRYFLFGMLALLAFSERLRTGNSRWLFAAGVCAGVAFCFRFDPALAVLAGIGLGIVLADPSPRRWWRDGSRLALGFLASVAPVGLWLAASVGPETVWREVFVRPLVMTRLQSLPVPELVFPDGWRRGPIREWFNALQFRAYPLLYLGYGAALGLPALGALRQRRAFKPVLLFAAVVSGGIFFTRAFGRADVAHLESAIPLVCLLQAHLLHLVFQAGWRPRRDSPGKRALARGALCLGALAAWIYLPATDRALNPALQRHKGVPPHVQRAAERIRQASAPGDTLLDLAASPLFFVLSGRAGPGYFDVIMPGTFLDESEERFFLARLEETPPALVLWPTQHFDHRPERSVERTAPFVARWVRDRYMVIENEGLFLLMAPRGTAHRIKASLPAE